MNVLSWLKWLFPLLFTIIIGFSAEARGSGSSSDKDGTDETDEDGGGEDGEDGETETETEEEDEDEEDLDLDELKQQLKNTRQTLSRVNAESASRRIELKKLKQQVDKFESEKLSEKERLEKKLTDAEARSSELSQQLTDVLISTEIRLRASAMNFHNPSDAAEFRDVLAGVEIDEETLEVSGVEDALKKLVEDRPYLVKPKEDEEDLGTPPGKRKKPKGPKPTKTEPEGSSKPLVRL